MPEGPKHIAMKGLARRMLRRLGAVKIVEEGIANVDIAGNCRGVWVAFEVGHSSKIKIESLRSVYNIIVHLPYCYTPELTMPLNQIEKRLDNKIIAWRCDR